jgi:hypothetical protein
MAKTYSFTDDEILNAMQVCADDLGPANIRKKLKISQTDANALYRAILRYLNKNAVKSPAAVSFDIQLEYAKHLGLSNVAEAYAKFEPRKFRLAAKDWHDTKTRKLKRKS